MKYLPQTEADLATLPSGNREQTSLPCSGLSVMPKTMPQKLWCRQNDGSEKCWQKGCGLAALNC
jgi:hypothetical protein